MVENKKELGNWFWVFLLMLGLLVFGAVSTRCQTIVEQLSDGSYIVEINNIEYRALPPQKVRELVKMKADYELLEEERDNYLKDIQTIRAGYERLLENKQSQYETSLKEERSNTKFWESEYNKEKSLRTSLVTKLEKCTGKLFGLRMCWGF